jgi:hypothetical protein
MQETGLTFRLILEGHPALLRGILSKKHPVFSYDKIKPLKVIPISCV